MSVTKVTLCKLFLRLRLKQCRIKLVDMKSKVNTAARIVLGLILIVFGLNKFLNYMPAPDLPEAAANFMMALKNTGYMFSLLGAVEILAGLLLISNKLIPFALVILAPISVNIISFHLNLAPASIGPAALVFVLNAWLIYAYWPSYKSLFK